MNIANNAIEKMQANELISELKSNGSYQPSEDNSEVISFLQNEAVSTQDICDQETYVFSDGSYITRVEDEYFTGNDVDEFLVTEELDYKK